MSETTTVLGRYIAFADRLVDGAAELDELKSLFAADATVEILDEPVVGMEAITGFYASYRDRIQECKHYWNTSSTEDGVLEADWVAAGRFADGRLLLTGGFERVRLNSNGLIAHLRNYPSRDAA